MLKTFLLYTCLFLIPLISKGQDSLFKKNIILKITPLYFIDFVSMPSTQVGFEYYLSKRQSIDFSYGQVFGKDSLTRKPNTGFRSKLEYKKYSKRKPNNYFGLETFFHKINYQAFSDFRGISNIYSESYRIKKKVFGISLKVGNQSALNKNFIIDWYAGLGLRLKNVNTNRTMPKDSFAAIDIQIDQIRDYPNRNVFGHIVLGVKIGYLLRKQNQ